MKNKLHSFQQRKKDLSASEKNIKQNCSDNWRVYYKTGKCSREFFLFLQNFKENILFFKHGIFLYFL
jgi:hypothetical protein